MDFSALKLKLFDDKRHHQQSEQTEGRRRVDCTGLLENPYLADEKELLQISITKDRNLNWKRAKNMHRQFRGG